MSKCNKKTSIGGQALIEGVMMRGPKKTAMAVRHTSGEIRTEEWENKANKSIFTRIPCIRGIFNFIDSMVIGYKTLMKSAEMSGMEEIEAESDDEEAVKKAEKENRIVKAIMPFVMVISAVLGVGLALFLFMYLPTLVYDYVCVPLFSISTDGFANDLLKAIVTGVLKIVIFLVYMILVSQMKDIKRVFRYHGAEHKTIFCYEHGQELTVENVRKESRFHPRCGTSFMILMMFVGVAISMFIPSIIGMFKSSEQEIHWAVYSSAKLLTLPLVVGVGYELLKLAGRHENWFTKAISAPGKWMQRITTAEPDDSMIECAITAFVAVIPEDETSDNW